MGTNLLIWPSLPKLHEIEKKIGQRVGGCLTGIPPGFAYIKPFKNFKFLKSGWEPFRSVTAFTKAS